MTTSRAVRWSLCVSAMAFALSSVGCRNSASALPPAEAPAKPEPEPAPLAIAETPAPEPQPLTLRDDDPLSLVPEEATVVAQWRLSQSAMANGFNAGLTAALANDPDAKELLAALSACNLDPFQMQDVTFAAPNLQSGNQRFALVVRGPGIGDRGNLECIDRKRVESGGEPGAMRFETRNGSDVVVFDEEVVGHLLRPDILVLVTESWAESFDGLRTGRVGTVQQGGLAPTLGRVDMSRSLWVAIGASELFASAAMASPDLAGLRAGTASMELDAGLILRLDLDVSDATQAARAEKFLAQQIDAMRPLATAAGLTDDVFRELQMRTDGKWVVLELMLNEAQLRQLGVQSLGGTPPSAGPPP